MRYKIENKCILPSFWINAPYDTFLDAKEALERGVTHNCEHCTDVPCKFSEEAFKSCSTS